MGSSSSISVPESPAVYAPAYKAWNDQAQGYYDLLQKYYRPQTVDKSPLELLDEMEGWRDMLKFYQKRDQEGNQDAQMKAALREQIYNDLTKPDTALNNQMLRSGLAQAFASGNKIGRSTGGAPDVGSSIVANIFGRELIANRDKNQQKAAQYLQANPVRENVPSAAELSQYQLGREAERANAYNQRLGLLSGLGQTSLENTVGQGQQWFGAISQHGANTANAMNAARGANNATMGNLFGSAMSLGGSLGAAAIL